MWRYQIKYDEYGSISWLCHTCQEFRYWRIVENEILRIPVGEVPVSWGKDSIRLAREGMLKLRKGRKARRRKRDKEGCKLG